MSKALTVLISIPRAEALRDLYSLQLAAEPGSDDARLAGDGLRRFDKLLSQIAEAGLPPATRARSETEAPGVAGQVAAETIASYVVACRRRTAQARPPRIQRSRPAAFAWPMFPGTLESAASAGARSPAGTWSGSVRQRFRIKSAARPRAAPGLRLPAMGTGTGRSEYSAGALVGKSVRGSARTAIGKTLTIGAAVGIAASGVKAVSEPRLQELFERLVKPTAAEKQLVGADVSGHPERMPPAEVADRLTRRVSGHGLSRQQRISVLNPAHYTFGAALGVAYVMAARRWPAVTRDLGVPAGLTIYGSTHASTLPILRIQEPPWKLPISAVLWEGTSHVVFGLALEGFRRAFLGLTGVSAGS